MTEIIARVKEWFDGLSERESRLVKLWLALMLGAAVVSSIVFVVKGVGAQKATIASERKNLKDIQSLEASYQAAKGRQKMAERKYALNAVSLFTLMQGIATRLELNLKDLNEQRYPVPESKLIEYRVVVNLDRLSIDRLSAVLKAVEEAKPAGLIRVTMLQVKTRFDAPDLLDATMTVSTWKLG